METTGSIMETSRAASIAARLTLATLSITGWEAVKTHKAETKAENERHGTKDVAKVTVKLLEHEALAARAKLKSAAYGEHRFLTRPTVNEGLRLLPMVNRLKHAEVMAAYAARDRALVEAFLGDYEAVRAEAPIRLNGLYVAAHWPSRDTLARKFGFETSYLPCPTEGQWTPWLLESVAVGEADLRERLQAALERMVERCSSAGPLHATVFSNLAELLELVPGFDFTGKYAAVVEASADLVRYTKDEVVQEPTLRDAIAKRAAEILDVFGTVPA